MTDSQPRHAQPSRISFVILLGVLLLGIMLVIAAVFSSLRGSLLPATPTPQIAGITAITPPDPLPDFTLTGMEGEPIRLSDFNGRYVMLFFGFTHCPDFCPLTLANHRQIKQLLGEQANEVAFVFVSVDGERDTPEVLGRYVRAFDPEFIGMTGSEADVRAMGVPYGLSFTLNKETPDDESYTVDHSTLSYIIDPQQRFHAVISYATPAEVVADYLRGILPARQ
jgi:protein SCO1/2